MKIIAIGASNSRTSINKELSTWAASQLPGATVKVIDLNDYEMPIYSIDRERESGIPSLAESFKSEVASADGVVISFAEYNGSYTSAYKNLLDWVSRLEGGIWANKPVFVLSTSPGPRGGKTVFNTAVASIPYHGATLAASFSLPSFGKNFDRGIVDAELKNEFEVQLEKFTRAINTSHAPSLAS